MTEDRQPAAPKGREAQGTNKTPTIENLKDPDWVMAPEDFEALAVALYGNLWRRALARTLGMHFQWVARFALPTSDPKHQPVKRDLALAMVYLSEHPEIAAAYKRSRWPVSEDSKTEDRGRKTDAKKKAG